MSKAKDIEKKIWERSSVWLERMPVTHEVASSSLVVPAILKTPAGVFFIINKQVKFPLFPQQVETPRNK